MQTTSISNPKVLSSVSVLKAANEQPQLAGDLISKTVENMQSQSVQAAAQPIDVSGLIGTGNIINITA